MKNTKRERLLIAGIAVLGVICGLVYWTPARSQHDDQLLASLRFKRMENVYANEVGNSGLPKNVAP